MAAAAAACAAAAVAVVWPKAALPLPAAGAVPVTGMLLQQVWTGTVVGGGIKQLVEALVWGLAYWGLLAQQLLGDSFGCELWI